MKFIKKQDKLHLKIKIYKNNSKIVIKNYLIIKIVIKKMIKLN